MTTDLKPGDRVRNVNTRRAGVVHALCTGDESHMVLVRYGKETRPTLVPRSALVRI